LCRRVGDDRQLLGIMLGMWEWHIVRGDLRLCVDLAAEGMALAERLNDPGVWMEALFMPGVTMFYRAEFAGARACYEKAIASYDDRERTKSWAAFTGHNAAVSLNKSRAPRERRGDAAETRAFFRSVPTSIQTLRR
jgi:hypothetical protein